MPDITIGTDVLYTPKALDGIPNTAEEVRAAKVTHVNDDGTYDLAVFWRNGVKPVKKVKLFAPAVKGKTFSLVS